MLNQYSAKCLKWFAASLAVSPFSLSGCVSNFALYREDPLWAKIIYFEIFIACRFLTLRNQILYENVCVKRYVNLKLKINSING